MAFEYEYQLQRSVPSAQAMLHSVPQWAIWDDHDYGLNNGDRTSPVRELGLASFKKYWANPAYGLPEAPGVFFRKRIAQVECFCLDGRSYRDPSDQLDGPAKTQIGTVQKAWLKQALRESDATFKLLIAGGAGRPAVAISSTRAGALIDTSAMSSLISSVTSVSAAWYCFQVMCTVASSIGSRVEPRVATI